MSQGSQKKYPSAPFFSTLVSQFFDRDDYLPAPTASEGSTTLSLYSSHPLPFNANDMANDFQTGLGTVQFTCALERVLYK